MCFLLLNFCFVIFRNLHSPVLNFIFFALLVCLCIDAHACCGVPCGNDDVSSCQCVRTSPGFRLRHFLIFVSDKLGRHSFLTHTHTHARACTSLLLFSFPTLSLLFPLGLFSASLAPSLPLSCLPTKGDWFVLRLIHLC